METLFAIFVALTTPAEPTTMSQEWQNAVVEACENVQPEPTFNMFNRWQNAVKEATR